jgi:hypothetical protein
MTKAKKKKAVKKKAAKSARSAARVAAAPARFTAAATIFVYQVNGETRVRTSPQVLGAGPGSIEWTVVNLTSASEPDVDITWQTESPWGGKDPIRIKGGNVRKSLDGARNGRYKYNVTCNGFTEDPEVEIPGN